MIKSHLEAVPGSCARQCPTASPHFRHPASYWAQSSWSKPSEFNHVMSVYMQSSQQLLLQKKRAEASRQYDPNSKPLCFDEASESENGALFHAGSKVFRCLWGSFCPFQLSRLRTKTCIWHVPWQSLHMLGALGARWLVRIVSLDITKAWISCPPGLPS